MIIFAFEIRLLRLYATLCRCRYFQPAAMSTIRFCRSLFDAMAAAYVDAA